MFKAMQRLAEGATPLAVIKSDKTKTEYSIFSGLRGHSFFHVEVSAARVPAELDTRYISLDAAIRAVNRYVANSEKSIAVKDQEVKEYHKANGIEFKTKAPRKSNVKAT